MEVNGIEAHVFPYQQFITASLIHEDANDVLRLAFSSHDIEIAGNNLRDLLTALQDFGVKLVRVMPERYRTIASTEQSMIARIRISPVE